MAKTNADRLWELEVEILIVERNRADVLSAFREKVRALKTEARPGEKSVADLLADLTEKIGKIKAEKNAITQQPKGQTWLEFET